MVIINPSIASQPAAFNRPAGPAPVIPADRVMIATVLGQRSQHLYELAAGNLRLMAESQTPLRSGEELRLVLLGKDARQRPTLRVLSDPQPAIAQQLRQTLPQQQPPNQAAATLSQLLSKPLDPTIGKLLQGFFQQLPSSAQLSDSDQLRQSILRSGLFREQQLLMVPSGASAAGDLKSTMLKLAEQLQQRQQSPPPMSGKPEPPSSRTEHAAVATSYSSLARAGSPVLSNLNGKATGPATTNSTALPSQTPKQTGHEGQARGQLPLPYHSDSLADDLPGLLKALPRLPVPQDDDPGTALTRLIAELRGAVARIESHQLLHLQSRDVQQGQYLIELPVRHGDQIDIWQLQIQWQHRDSSANADDQTPTDPPQQRQWTITLNFDLPGLGEVRAQVRQQGDALDLDFTIASESTHQLFRQHADDLVAGIVAQGAPQPRLQLQCARPFTGQASELTNTRFVAVKA